MSPPQPDICAIKSPLNYFSLIPNFSSNRILSFLSVSPNRTLLGVEQRLCDTCSNLTNKLTVQKNWTTQPRRIIRWSLESCFERKCFIKHDRENYLKTNHCTTD